MDHLETFDYEISLCPKDWNVDRSIFEKVVHTFLQNQLFSQIDSLLILLNKKSRY